MTLTKKLLLSASVVAGLSATLAATPASALTFSTSGPVTRYCSDGINTFSDGQGGMSCTDDLATILSGNATAPGGNLELYDDTDGLALTDPAWNQRSTLTADFDGHIVEFSSLTFDDWFSGDTSYGADNLANQWFSDALDAHGTVIRPTAAGFGLLNDAAIYSAFLAGVNVPGGISVPGLPPSQGFQRVSDPNIAYVFKENGKLTFGLAGHQSGGNIFPAGSPFNLLFQNTFASEVVKVSHNGETNFFYSFAQPTDSGQVNKDGFSHNGNFEFMFEVGAKTPEPGTILGLMAVGGLAVAARRKSSRKS